MRGWRPCADVRCGRLFFDELLQQTASKRTRLFSRALWRGRLDVEAADAEANRHRANGNAGAPREHEAECDGGESPDHFGWMACGRTVPGAPDVETTAVGAVSLPLKAAMMSLAKPNTDATMTKYGASHDGALDVAQFNVPAISLQPRLSNTLEAKPQAVTSKVRIV
jgi:hypothetical protein